MVKENSSIRSFLPSAETHSYSNAKITRHKEGFYLYEVKGIQDEMAGFVVMDMSVLRNGDVNLSLRDGSNRDKQGATINFSNSISGSSMVRNMAENLRRIPYELFEHEGKIVDRMPPSPVGARQQSSLKIIPANEISQGAVRGIQGDGSTMTLMDIDVAGKGSVKVSIYREGTVLSQRLAINFMTALEETKFPILSATFHKIAQDLIGF